MKRKIPFEKFLHTVVETAFDAHTDYVPYRLNGKLGHWTIDIIHPSTGESTACMPLSQEPFTSLRRYLQAHGREQGTPHEGTVELYPSAFTYVYGPKEGKKKWHEMKSKGCTRFR
jgi:hypothetical protein